MMIEYIRTNRNFKELPPHFEGFRMGGEWPNQEILPEAEVIILHENNQVSKIFPQKSYPTSSTVVCVLLSCHPDSCRAQEGSDRRRFARFCVLSLPFLMGGRRLSYSPEDLLCRYSVVRFLRRTGLLPRFQECSA